MISRQNFQNVSNFKENSRKEFRKFTGPTDVILRCCANANEEISIYYTKSRLKTVNVNYLVLKCDT